nr:MAG TPA: hypothetical protein [Caudoviricetes sp.]DAT21037.1 MAG TPA: hypothetical protein [Caudoviricetes sp.]DAV27922.1 MAG TPA: hypothetical protein [Caudoviricetes sp.]
MAGRKTQRSREPIKRPCVPCLAQGDPDTQDVYAPRGG